MKSICVFCGSSVGNDPDFREKAEELGRILASEKLELVYGGGSIGLMGVLADSVLQNGGNVVGVIPEFLVEKEVDHKGITRMHTVSTMHERKQLMAELSDGFIALPGGLGTLDELAEILTWIQLGLLRKPVGLLNVNGFFNALVDQLNMMVDKDFLKIENRDLLIIDEGPKTLLDEMNAFQSPQVQKWLKPDQI